MGLLQWLGLTTPGHPLELGETAPVVTAPDDEGTPFNFAGIYRPGTYALVFFFPKANSPGCTAQACSLRDEFTELQLRKVQIVGVSADSPEALKKFKEKNRLPFPLLSDEQRVVADAFGVPSILGMTHRQTFLIHDAKIVWRDLRASTRWQARDVLTTLEKLPPA
jgi:peroxiredoxin Q/BCP